VYSEINSTAGQPTVQTEFMKRIDRDQPQERVIGCRRKERLDVSVHDAVQQNMAEGSNKRREERHGPLDHNGLVLVGSAPGCSAPLQRGIYR